MAEKAILYDATWCTACRGCQAACKQWNENDEVIPEEENGVKSVNRGSYENPPDLSPQTWLKMEFREVERNGKVDWLFTRHACMQCTTAACVWVCPTYARTHDDLGSVTIDLERCIGCGRCGEYCPFDVPKLGSYDVSPRFVVELGVPKIVSYKCTFCKDRLEDGLTQACVKTCPTNALLYGDHDELVTEGRKRVQSLKAKGYSNAYLYGENELGGLHVMYVLADEPTVYGLPEKPQVGTYPEFDETTFPDWYSEAIADGRLPVFPSGARREWYLQPQLVPALGPPEPAWPPVPAGPGIGWGTPALLTWFGLGVAGALGWLIRRRMTQQEGKTDNKERVK